MSSVKKSCLSFVLAAQAAALCQPAPLHLKQTISLAGVGGRIDHLAVDLRGRRLFVAALGNNTVEIVDLQAGRRVHSITGLQEPQGIFYLPDTNRLYVAGGGDGACRIYDAASYKLVKTVALGEDADNIRYDPAARRLYIGYGAGALGVIDPDGNKLADIRLDAHPESFQLESNGPRIFVNLPNAKKVAVIDRRKAAVVASWGTGGAQANYPMALDEPNRRLFVACRQPARLLVLTTDTGALVTQLATAGDCDDLFYDAPHQRLYASGGEGVIAVVRQRDRDHYEEVARIPTTSGARTSLLVPDLGTLFLAVRQQGSQAAGIGVYEVGP